MVANAVKQSVKQSAQSRNRTEIIVVIVMVDGHHFCVRFQE